MPFLLVLLWGVSASFPNSESSRLKVGNHLHECADSWRDLSGSPQNSPQGGCTEVGLRVLTVSKAHQVGRKICSIFVVLPLCREVSILSSPVISYNEFLLHFYVSLMEAGSG